ncbi:o-succinylbenzoate synthase [Runella slithyformis]|uniref:Mandelate racemase/muconate lactonizing protein n=1 Tax=Runella slithyformis (strain ATCC 29530 / DSM 19594 / LMG 11500 / NCIMB 11436 / LSU 4) TaxID=761193 RepID=A0A7U3ZN77_RUNSL|nr:o-succinylbenzoate synthase [Runella slithyformis]AEI50331.1 Mandelate racemase/muconate lactonizing protein [Runella slithyformis DSM 19594]
MPLQAHYQPYRLNFRFAAGTSRGILTEKTSWFIKIYDKENPSIIGIGECGPLSGLSIDDRPDFEDTLQNICREFNRLDLEIYSWNISIILEQLVGNQWPSIRFGFESAMLDYLHGGKRALFDNDFVSGQKGVPINGLVWMGSHESMLQQVEEKISAGFTTIKLKIGAIGFQEECAILAYIRRHFSAREISLRVDANGAFTASDVHSKLKKLAEYELHSIEQPIAPKQIDLMAELCEVSPVPIGLDEELIGKFDYAEKRRLLKQLKPKYIILKPTLLGGFELTREWIETAHRLDIGWWITSALESNVGLNAISQFTAEFDNPLPQGLGTGQLYHNNIPSPLTIQEGHLLYDSLQAWDFGLLNSSRISSTA